MSIGLTRASKTHTYPSITVDIGCEQLTAQYEAVHNNTLEHIEMATQVISLRPALTATNICNQLLVMKLMFTNCQH